MSWVLVLTFMSLPHEGGVIACPSTNTCPREVLDNHAIYFRSERSCRDAQTAFASSSVKAECCEKPA